MSRIFLQQEQLNNSTPTVFVSTFVDYLRPEKIVCYILRTTLIKKMHLPGGGSQCSMTKAYFSKRTCHMLYFNLPILPF